MDQPGLAGWSQVLTASPGEGSGIKAKREKTNDDFTIKNWEKKYTIAWHTKMLMHKMSESSSGVYCVGV